MKRIVLLIFVSLLLQQLQGQTRKYVNEFMHLGVGGRQLGMGKAGSASVNDVYATYWNPSALAGIEDNLQVGFMHNFYFQTIANYDYLAVAAKAGENSGIGFSMLRFGVDGILNTLDLIQNGEIRYDKVTQFSAVDYAFMPSFGHKFRLIKNYKTEISWGGNAKIIHRRVGDFARAWGFGMDAAFKAEDVDKKWGVSLVLRDITGTYNNWSFEFTQSQKDVLARDSGVVPVSSLEVAAPRFSLGGYQRFRKDKFYGMYEANLDFTTDGKRNTLISSAFLSADPRIGIEGGLVNEDKNFTFCVRAGVYNFQRETRQNGKKGMTVQPTAGVGVVLKQLTIDYALAGFGAGGSGLYSNIISVKFSINKK